MAGNAIHFRWFWSARNLTWTARELRSHWPPAIHGTGVPHARLYAIPWASNRNQRSQHMDCPICGANAEQIPTTVDDVSIVCPTCGEYDVASAVLATGQLQKLEPEQRRDALDQAKRSAHPGARPMITDYLLSAGLLARLGA